MTDHVIVTVQTRNDDFCTDMELPLKMTINELSIGLLETVKAIAPKTFEGCEKLSLWFNKKQLLPDETLETNHVWDGSIIVIGGR